MRGLGGLLGQGGVVVEAEMPVTLKRDRSCLQGTKGVGYFYVEQAAVMQDGSPQQLTACMKEHCAGVCVCVCVCARVQLRTHECMRLRGEGGAA